MSDNDIIAQISARNQKVTSQTYQKYRNEFVRWMKKKYRCPEEDARELYQITFFAFYDKVISGKLTHLTHSIKTYLFGIGKNKFHSFQRDNARYEYEMNEGYLSSYERQLFRPDREEKYQQLEQAVKKLGTSCQQILLMHYYENRDMQYITDQLNYKNASTTKSQKYKCMERLRKMLDKNPLIYE